MTAHVLALEGDGPGKGRLSPVLAHGGRVMKFAVYDYAMGSDNYTVGGNDISEIWDDFPGGVEYIGIEQQDTNTAADQRMFAVDYSAQTLVQYDAVATEETATDQDVVALRFLVAGWR